MIRVARLLLAGIVLALPTFLLAADPPAGSYKIMLPFQGGDQALWLLKLESKDGKWTGTALSSPKVPPAKVDGVTFEKDLLSFLLSLGKSGSFLFEGRIPKAKDGKILGVMTTREGEVFPAVLEPTTLASLDPFDVSRETLTKLSNGVEVTEAALVCLSRAEAKKAKPEEVKVWAEKAVLSAEPFGPKWKRNVVLQIAEVLGGQEGFTGLALEYAEQAKKGLEETDKPIVRKRVLTLLANALDKAGKKEDAKKIREESDKLSSIAVKPFTGRKGKSERVVLVELFSVQLPTSEAADLAAAALVNSYKPTEMVLLQYHLNNAQVPDPLANAESEGRAKFYETTRSTPAIFFNGKAQPPAAGGAAESQSKYDEFNAVLADLLEKPTALKLTAVATRKGNTIEIKTDVANLPETGPDIRLRVALVEDEVAYTVGTKAMKFVQVVRHFPSGVVGVAMKTKNATEKYTVDVETLRKNLKSYFDKIHETRPFPSKERPLELKKLHVVAFVQNDETGEVLNAVQVDVKGE